MIPLLIFIFAFVGLYDLAVLFLTCYCIYLLFDFEILKIFVLIVLFNIFFVPQNKTETESQPQQNNIAIEKKQQ